MFIKCKEGESCYFINSNDIDKIYCKDNIIMLLTKRFGLLSIDSIHINNYIFTVKNIDDLMRTLNM